MAYGEHTFEWFSGFRRGENSLRDSERSGKNVAEVRKIIKEDR
jgi:hypothetical protein